ncbi:MAG: antibiotic biosynthesis monooxygenase [Vicingaceae bacterium]
MKIERSYMAVIFTSIRTSNMEGYDEMNEMTFKEVERSPGFLGSESYSSNDGRHVTIAYFKDEESIAIWKENTLHLQAQELGKNKWYQSYKVRVCRVEREYESNN